MEFRPDIRPRETFEPTRRAVHDALRLEDQ
jgi:hypothetical protein